ncbi:MAG: helix-turn-helix domain-containing protein [Sediminibacterium sp.]|nr:helix-turn-helix domain-containing protein [Sediminibacterium sp.]
MKKGGKQEIPIGTQALIFSKLYYSVLSKKLENLDIERYYSVLNFLYHHNGCCQQYICNSLEIDKTIMVKIVDYFIKSEFVERQENPDDRREHFIILTKKGKKETEKIVQAFEDLDKEMFRELDKGEKETFVKVLHHLNLRLKEFPLNDLFFNYRKTGKRKTPAKS